eukprot:983813-Pelagomonas_calceolata.AAC.10
MDVCLEEGQYRYQNNGGGLTAMEAIVFEGCKMTEDNQNLFWGVAGKCEKVKIGSFEECKDWKRGCCPCGNEQGMAALENAKRNDRIGKCDTVPNLQFERACQAPVWQASRPRFDLMPFFNGFSSACFTVEPPSPWLPNTSNGYFHSAAKGMPTETSLPDFSIRPPVIRKSRHRSFQPSRDVSPAALPCLPLHPHRSLCINKLSSSSSSSHIGSSRSSNGLGARPIIAIGHSLDVCLVKKEGKLWPCSHIVIACFCLQLGFVAMQPHCNCMLLSTTRFRKDTEHLHNVSTAVGLVADALSLQDWGPCSHIIIACCCLQLGSGKTQSTCNDSGHMMDFCGRKLSAGKLLLALHTRLHDLKGSSFGTEDRAISLSSVSLKALREKNVEIISVMSAISQMPTRKEIDGLVYSSLQVNISKESFGKTIRGERQVRYEPSGEKGWREGGEGQRRRKHT